MTLLFNRGKSVKDKIVLALGSSWPLNAKEILANIKSNFNANVTYQAVYKSINELLEEEVIVKSDSRYMLNKEWLAALKDYIHSADRSYNFGISSGESAPDEQMIVSSIYDWYNYVGTIMEKFAHDEHMTSAPVIIRGSHEWNVLVFGKDDFNRMQKLLGRYKVYTVMLIDNPFAQAMSNYWKDIGVNVAIVDAEHYLASSNDLVVIGDYVIQARFSKDQIKGLQAFYEHAMTINDMDFSKLHKEIFFKESDIHVLTVKNKPLADRIRSEVMDLFK